MESTEIQTLLSSHIDDCQSEIQIDGSHVNVVVISAQFEGLNTLKKQQLAYGALNAAIADGRIHAVHMKTYTPAEWQEQKTS